jgi:hypothetical protein
MKSNRNQATGGEAKAKPEVIKLGLDLHARQVTECRQLDGSTPKPAQKWDPWKLLDKVEEWVKAGIKVYSCYEAGACGYWYHRELIKRGAVNFVVAPRPLENQRRKHQKTDRLDARALLDDLESYLRGKRDCDEHRRGAEPRTGRAPLGGTLPRAARTQSTSSRGAGSGASSDPGNPSTRGLVAASGLEAV